MTQERIDTIIERLIGLGEDAAELKLYGSIFSDMEPAEQSDLYISLLEEAADLEDAAASQPGIQLPSLPPLSA